MGIDKEQENRLISRGMPADDPAWGQVSSFLDAVESTYADVPAARYERTVVNAVAQEARALRNDPQFAQHAKAKEPFTFKTHRLLIGVVAAAVVVLPAGVAAAATGNGPLAYLMPGATPETSAPAFETTDTAIPSETPTETPSATPSAEESDEPEEVVVEPSPEPSPRTTTKAPVHRDNDDADDDADKQGEDEGDDEGEAEHAEAESGHDSDDDHESEDADPESEDEEDN